MPGAQEGGINHAPPGKLPEIMWPPCTHSRKMVLGTPLPGENPPKLLLLKPNPLLDSTVAYFSLKK